MTEIALQLNISYLFARFSSHEGGHKQWHAIIPQQYGMIMWIAGILMDSDGNGKISENGDGGKLLMEGCSKSSKVQLVLVSFRWYGMVWYGMV